MAYRSPNIHSRQVARQKYKTGIAGKNQLEGINAQYQGYDILENGAVQEVYRDSKGNVFRKNAYSMLSPKDVTMCFAPTRDQVPQRKFEAARRVCEKIANAEFIEEKEGTLRSGEPCRVLYYKDNNGKEFHYTKEDVENYLKIYNENVNTK